MINYYIFDRIEEEATDYERGCVTTWWGYKGKSRCEVFPMNGSESEKELADLGFAKCDAPNWNETMVVEESAWDSL